MKQNRDQRKRFEETARQLECDEDEDRFNATLKQIVTSEAKEKKERLPND